jgi:DNA-directed RNA polymerase II subunit RPB2
LDIELSVALGLSNSGEVAAFLELYGFWLGAGSLNFRVGGSGSNAVTFSQVAHGDTLFIEKKIRAAGLTVDDWQVFDVSSSEKKFVITHPSWFEYFATEYGKRYQHGGLAELAPQEAGVEATSVNSAKWLWWWVLKLCSLEQARLVLEGYRRADGVWSDGDDARQFVAYTSSVLFRDQLVHLCLHAGFSAYFEILYRVGAVRGYSKIDGATGDKKVYSAGQVVGDEAAYKPIVATADHWRVFWGDQVVDRPNMQAQSVCEEHYEGRVWCVHVQHTDHLVFAQRAGVDESGTVTKASRPIVVGQCTYDQGGYFVINGSEKVLIAQERMAANHVYGQCTPNA